MSEFVPVLSVADLPPGQAAEVTVADRAVALFREHRAATTPVLIAANLGRSGERVTVAPLAEFDAESVDMLTIVIVGSRQSRIYRCGDGRLIAYTPRGYGACREEPS